MRSHAEPTVEEMVGWLKSHPGKRIELRRPGRAYPGESTATKLIDYLNSSPGSRIERLLAEAENRRAVSDSPPAEMFAKLLQKFSTARPPKAVEDAIRRAADPDGPKRGQQEAFLKAHQVINAILSTYKLRPVLQYSVRGNWVIQWRPVQRFGKGAELEGNAVVGLLELAAQGFLPRVRRCKFAECKRWFFARFPDRSQFCEKNCQQDCFKNDPEHKEKHAAHMKELRDLDRERKRKREELPPRGSRLLRDLGRSQKKKPTMRRR